MFRFLSRGVDSFFKYETITTGCGFDMIKDIFLHSLYKITINYE